MPSGVARAPAVLVAAACLATACSVTRQRVDLAVRGDVPATADARGRKPADASFSRRITAAFRCPRGNRGDYGPQACFEMGERPDREVVGGPFGVAASTLPGVECSDLCVKRQISLAPIVTQLGPPPNPADVARRLAPSGPINDRLREVVRSTYEQEVRARYRRYADYLDRELADADYVEIGPAKGGPTRRYGSGSIYDGLDDAMGEIADNYAALEWSRFERQWGRGSAAPRAGQPRPSTGPDSPPAPAPAEAGEEPGTVQGTARPTEKAPASPPSTVVAGGDDVTCRRPCGLRYRACLARCRNQPVSGGEYDACAYDCSDGSLTCRGACGTVASP
jgi:hypothetical protein